MKVYVTGGSGFIGSHVVRKLLARGDEVCALVLTPQCATKLEAMGACVVPGDIAAKASMRQSMQGSDVVLHIAGWYQVGVRDVARMETINVQGARNVLELAYELGVPKIVHVSSLVVMGDTQGQLVDETFYQGGPFTNTYHRTKWQAHYEVALPLIEQGAPIVIVMPGGAYGPHDHSFLTYLLRQFYREKLPIVVGGDSKMSLVHVKDVAKGIILAADKGQVGEGYILTEAALSVDEFMSLLSDVSGKRPPRLNIPPRYLRPLPALVEVLERFMPVPQMYSAEFFRTLGVTFIGRSDKARRELGWQPRPLREGMRETMAWIAQTTSPPAPSQDGNKQLTALALTTALFLALRYRRAKEKR
ncbi:MAG: NAD-dependent epimerase/dehydratase family protein [Anaerolineae bacterium]